MRSLQMDVDDEISNLVDLHMGMFGGGWKWQDLQGLLWLYLTRSSLEFLKKFHWMTLGGRSNQLSHVSSPLLSKLGEY
ncbi:hypothetical protein Tco_1100283 [Tanacetum coccineum]